MFPIDRYFKILLNNCFKEPVVNTLECSFKFNPTRAEAKSTVDLFLVNSDLLTFILLEWNLIKYSSLSIKTKQGLCSCLFETMQMLLNDKNPSFSYHSNVFAKFNYLDRLMDYILDANTDNFIYDTKLCDLFIQIFKNFNHVCYSLASKTKQLLASYNRYLNTLHPEKNFNIVNLQKSYFFNLILSKCFGPSHSEFNF
jgi:hypothetical protein